MSQSESNLPAAPYFRNFEGGYAVVRQGPSSISVEWAGVSTTFSENEEKDARIPHLVGFLDSLIKEQKADQPTPFMQGIEWALKRMVLLKSHNLTASEIEAQIRQDLNEMAKSS